MWWGLATHNSRSWRMVLIPCVNSSTKLTIRNLHILWVLTLLQNAIKLWHFTEVGSNTFENSLNVLLNNCIHAHYTISKYKYTEINPKVGASQGHFSSKPRNPHLRARQMNHHMCDIGDGGAVIFIPSFFTFMFWSKLISLSTALLIWIFLIFLFRNQRKSYSLKIWALQSL